MYSEENEKLATDAYGLFRAKYDNSAPEWASYPNKHIWRDLVQTYTHKPHVVNGPANAIEECVVEAMGEKAKEAESPVPTTAPLVIAPPSSPKPSTKQKKEK